MTQGTLAKPREPWALIHNAVGVKKDSQFSITTTQILYLYGSLVCIQIV